MCRNFVTVTTRFRRAARSAQSRSSTVSLTCGSRAACDTGRGRSVESLGFDNYVPLAWAEEFIDPARAVDHPRLATLYVVASHLIDEDYMDRKFRVLFDRPYLD